jgi:hypothetical protein
MGWACSELADAYERYWKGIQEVALSYVQRDDPRTLVVVMGCPCCGYADEAYSKGPSLVLASPLRGIDAPPRVHRAKLSPPYRTPGRFTNQAKDGKTFLASFREAIEEALKS